MNTLVVLKHPAPDTLGVTSVYDGTSAVTSGAELMTQADYDAWVLAEMAGGWKPVFTLPPAPLLRQDTLTVWTRLTDAEQQALHNAQATDYRFWKFVQMAGTGVIDQADPNYNAAVQLLDSLGIIAANRWPTLLAP